MKSVVFDNGLLLMALSAIGTLRLGELGHLPLLIQGEVSFDVPSSLTAFLPLGGPRPSDVDFGSSRDEMTRMTRTQIVPTRRGPTRCQLATEITLPCYRRHSGLKETTPCQRAQQRPPAYGFSCRRSSGRLSSFALASVV